MEEAILNQHIEETMRVLPIIATYAVNLIGPTDPVFIDIRDRAAEALKNCLFSYVSHEGMYTNE